MMASKGRVTGVGGVFLRARDPKTLNEWYQKSLGFPLTDYGVTFLWAGEDAGPNGMTTWSTFPQDTEYFGKGSSQAVMVNYRVDDLDALLEKLRAANVEIEPLPPDEGYGRFAWLTDPEGNRMELWQPVDDGADEKEQS